MGIVRKFLKALNAILFSYKRRVLKYLHILVINFSGLRKISKYESYNFYESYNWYESFN